MTGRVPYAARCVRGAHQESGICCVLCRDEGSGLSSEGEFDTTRLVGSRGGFAHGGPGPGWVARIGRRAPHGVWCRVRMGEGGACAPPTHLRADAVNFVGKMSRTYGGRGGVCPTQSPHSRYSELRGVRCRVRMGEGGASAPPTHLRADTAMPLLHAGLMTGSSGA